jgi:hypothetical protein
MSEAKELTAQAAMAHEWMTPSEVAEVLRVKERTLEDWRLASKGPDYYRKGPGNKSQILYQRADVVAWLAKFRVRTET